MLHRSVELGHRGRQRVDLVLKNFPRLMLILFQHLDSTGVRVTPLFNPDEVHDQRNKGSDDNTDDSSEDFPVQDQTPTY